MKKDIYRKAALERLDNVDQLDKVMKIAPPLSWLALAGAAVIIAAALIWSVTGSLPSTVTASGVIVSSTASANTITSQMSGTVELLAGEGQYVGAGDEVARITRGGKQGVCLSSQNGFISGILVPDGTPVEQGTELFRVRPWCVDGQRQVAVCYVPVGDAGRIRRGLPAVITLTVADSSTCGHMEGRVINVDTWATSARGIEAVVGTDNGVAAMFMRETGVCAVTCELLPAAEGSGSVNGYYWSDPRGGTLEISDRMMCSVRIVTETEKPIFKLFPMLKDIRGDKR